MVSTREMLSRSIPYYCEPFHLLSGAAGGEEESSIQKESANTAN